MATNDFLQRARLLLALGVIVAPSAAQGDEPIAGDEPPVEEEVSADTQDEPEAASDDAQDEGAAQDAAQDATPEPREPPAPKEPVRSGAPHYRFLGDRETLFSAWLGGGHAERLELGTSAGGRELFAFQFGGPGPRPLNERTTVLLLGGLDGVSLSGSEAVLSIVDTLLAAPDALPADATFVAVPWANPDGLQRWLESGCTDGRNDRPIDDDRDGQVDEDRPDDLDGDGVILEMLIEDPSGDWVRGADGRFLRPARAGEAPRYRRLREGRDDDGDGAYNEDQAGGVMLDRNFPLHWAGPWTGALSGPWPLSEPGSRALADFARSRRTAVVLLFQGNHGRLAIPGGVPPAEGVLELPLAADRPTFRALADSFERTTARPMESLQTLYAVYEEARPGAAIDWFYTALGALSVEIGVWGPDIGGSANQASEGSFSRSASPRGAREGSLLVQDSRAVSTLVEEAWAAWDKNSRGGLGFVDWQPFDLGNEGQVLIGGWKPYTCFNPPGELLEATQFGLGTFVNAVGHGLPKLEVEIVESRRTGRVALLRARVHNAGTLPTGCGPDGAGFGSRLSLTLPPGVVLMAGEQEVELGHLPGSGRSATFEWLFVAPEDSVFKLSVESRWSPPGTREVRL